MGGGTGGIYNIKSKFDLCNGEEREERQGRANPDFPFRLRRCVSGKKKNRNSPRELLLTTVSVSEEREKKRSTTHSRVRYSLAFVVPWRKDEKNTRKTNTMDS